VRLPHGGCSGNAQTLEPAAGIGFVLVPNKQIMRLSACHWAFEARRLVLNPTIGCLFSLDYPSEEFPAPTGGTRNQGLKGSLCQMRRMSRVKAQETGRESPAENMGCSMEQIAKKRLSQYKRAMGEHVAADANNSNMKQDEMPCRFPTTR